MNHELGQLPTPAECPRSLHPRINEGGVMKKMRLTMETLKVDSFPTTTQVVNQRGSVHAHEPNEPSETCVLSCWPSCEPQETCPYTARNIAPRIATSCVTRTRILAGAALIALSTVTPPTGLARARRRGGKGTM
jgi:hypothetical protein